MKNFRKQFMELTLIFAAINSVSMVKAFAQEIDYSDINRQNTELASTQGEVERSELDRFFFARNYSEVSLPKNRKLTSIEKDQKKLLQCAVKFITKRKGLYQGPEILQSIIVKAMDSDKLTADSYVLSETTRECWDAYNNLTNFKKKETKKEELGSIIELLPRSTSSEIKVADFILKQYFSNFICSGHELSASASFFMGLTAGGSLLKCLNSQGVIRNYLGPKIGVGFGFGAKVQYSKNTIKDKVLSGVIAGSATNGLDKNQEYTNYTVILGAINATEYNKIKTQSLGLAVDMGEIYGTLNIRFLNGFRNWSYVIDQLK